MQCITNCLLVEQNSEFPLFSEFTCVLNETLNIFTNDATAQQSAE